MITFDGDVAGSLPIAWEQGVTGRGAAKWAVAQDESAPSKPNVENNVSLYYAQGGRRITIKYVDAPVPPKVWHTLRVEFSGQRISVALNGKTYIDVQDDHIKAAGAVGLWTKADSVTAFDDFSFGSSK